MREVTHWQCPHCKFVETDASLRFLKQFIRSNAGCTRCRSSLDDLVPFDFFNDSEKSPQKEVSHG